MYNPQGRPVRQQWGHKAANDDGDDEIKEDKPLA
jgi:hypothetical protein